MRFLAPRKRIKVISVGLGDCKALYSGTETFWRDGAMEGINDWCILAGCLYTEWFDLDEPCSKGEVESVYVTNVFASRLGKYVSQCDLLERQPKLVISIRVATEVVRVGGPS